MRNEIKLDFPDKDLLENLIQKCYFENGDRGKLCNTSNDGIIINNDDIIYDILRGLNNFVIKLSNSSIIDGSMRFIISETDDSFIKLDPISIYCIVEDELYSFY